MTKSYGLAMLTALLGLFAMGSSTAQNAEQETASASDLRVNGFGTLGLVTDHSDFGGSFRREISQAPEPSKRLRANVDSRIGLQANYAVNTKVELVGQIVLKDRALSNGKNDAVEWAFASFRPTPDITLRVGRTSPDLFLLSETRNVGFSYVPVRPPVDFYGFLSFPQINGLDVTKSWTVGDAQWRAKVFSGISTFPLVVPFNQALTPGLRPLQGFVLSHEREGLLIRATVARSKLEVDSAHLMTSIAEGLNALSALPVPSVAAEAQSLGQKLQSFGTVFTYTSFGATYDNGKWLAASEFMRLQSDNTIAAAKAAYVMVGHRQGALTLHTTASVVRSSFNAYAQPNWVGALTPVIGATAANSAQSLGSTTASLLNSWRLDQKTLSVGGRWDVDPRVAFKLQWDHSWVARNGSLMWAGGADGGQTDVITALVDFVF